MNTLSARVLAALAAANMDQSELARRIGTSSVAVNNWCTGATKSIKGENLLKAAAALKVRPEWLSSGIGKMEADGSYQPPEIPAGASIGVYENPDELDPEKYIWIDRYEINLSAGCGNIQWVIHQKDPICFRANWFKFKNLPAADCKALYVRGRSMEPVLQDYDTVLIDTSKKEIVDGEIYAVSLGEEFYIKAIHRKPGMIVLRSYNKDFEDIEVVGEQMNELCIIGKMVWRGG